MNHERQWALGLLASCIATGCAGNGEGLDENGRPIGSGGEAPLTATLPSIQAHVFTPICTQCHTGAAAPLGFRLDADSAFAMLVNAPSTEVPSLQRVTPGDPDASYLIQKLEGRAAVGAQMPLGQPPLPQATIDVIRQWIANGAQAGAAASAVNVMPMQLHAINASKSEVLLQADGEIRVATLTADTVQVVNSRGEASAAHIEVRSLDPTVLAIRPATGGAWPPDLYQLRIQSATDREGLPVGEFSWSFEVGAAP